MLKKLTGEAWVLTRQQDTIQDTLQELYNVDVLELPCAADSIWISYDRLPVLSDMAKPRNSPLINSLMERTGEVALVVDMVLHGSDAMRFIALFSDRTMIDAWLRNLSRPDMIVKPLTDLYFLISSPLSAFVKSRPESI